MRCEPDLEDFHLAKEVLLRQFGKAALNAGTGVSLIGKRAQAAEVVAGSLLEVAETDPL